MKRSRSLALTGLMATASLSLTACGDGGGGASGSYADAEVYRTLADCKIARPAEPAACDNAYAQALQDDEQNGRRFNSLQECEAQYGAEACQQTSRGTGGGGGHGGAYFARRMGGFAIGRMDGQAERGAPFYPDGDGVSGAVGNGGGRAQYDYTSGRYVADGGVFSGEAGIRAAPRSLSASGARSRGGFGGWGRGGGFHGG